MDHRARLRGDKVHSHGIVLNQNHRLLHLQMNTGLQIGQWWIHAECVESMLESARCSWVQRSKVWRFTAKQHRREVSSLFFYPECFKCEDAGQNGGYLSAVKGPMKWLDDDGWICFFLFLFWIKMDSDSCSPPKLTGLREMSRSALWRSETFC